MLNLRHKSHLIGGVWRAFITTEWLSAVFLVTTYFKIAMLGYILIPILYLVLTFKHYRWATNTFGGTSSQALIAFAVSSIIGLVSGVVFIYVIKLTV